MVRTMVRTVRGAQGPKYTGREKIIEKKSRCRQGIRVGQMIENGGKCKIDKTWRETNL